MKNLPLPEGALVAVDIRPNLVVYEVIGSHPDVRVHRQIITSRVMRHETHRRFNGKAPNKRVFEIHHVITEARYYNLVDPMDTDNYLFVDEGLADKYHGEVQKYHRLDRERIAREDMLKRIKSKA